MEPIKIILVDNEEVFREGLSKLLEGQQHIKVVYKCATGKEAIEKSAKVKPDIVLIGSEIEVCNIKETIEEIRKHSPEVKVAVVARPGSDTSPLDIVNAGSRACLSKSISSTDLVKSVELISSGRIIISPLFADEFLGEITSLIEVKSSGSKEDSGLSSREAEIVRLIVEGATNKEIAKRLFIAENTAKVHVKNILKKFDLRNRQQIVAYAILRNWVSAEISKEAPHSGNM